MIHRLLNILFPCPCILCGYLSEFLCPDCEKHLDFTPHIRTVNDLKIYSSLLYKKGVLVEQLIESFKYKHQSRLAPLLASRMMQSMRLFDPSPDVILVPVPLHSQRLHERGYNQAELLAKAVAKSMGLTCLPLLKRTRDTEQQARLSTKQERLVNLCGAFEVKGCLPENSRIILVDDIVTTGSTLLECKAALERAGARSIMALTLANRDEKPPYPWNRRLT